jgi:hypothetical protein
LPEFGGPTMATIPDVTGLFERFIGEKTTLAKKREE